MSSNEIDLRTKYGMDLPPDLDHPILGAMEVVERTRAMVNIPEQDGGALNTLPEPTAPGSPVELPSNVVPLRRRG